ncbi:glycosyltransferase family 2 protein [Treponema socranskii]|uniref:glycosyltransferase family 2 protein n=1 Tax=Treponema socranskii TaxID=53419 RepID=UPI003D8E90F0
MENPKITVIMSVYNGAEFLRETIESVLKQTYTNFEFIITDNASTDETVSIIRSYNDSRIKLTVNEENKGYVANLNSMIKEAAGKYIIRQDADDIIRKNKFEKLFEYMEAHPSIGACGYYINVFGAYKERIRQELDNKKIRAAMLFENQMDSLSIIRASLFKDYDLSFEEGLIPAEDYKFWFEVMKHSELANIPCFLLDYRIHGTNTSIEKKEQGDRNRLEVQLQIYEYLFNQKITEETKEILKLLYISNNCSEGVYRKIIVWLEQIACFAKNGKQIDEETFLYYMARRWFIFCIHNKKLYFRKPKFVKLAQLLRFIYDLLRKKI